MNVTNGICKNKCENYPNCKPCGNWKNRYEEYKKGMGYKNKDIADHLGRKLNSVEVSVSRDPFPDTFKLAIITYEQMLLKGRITYDEPEVYKAKADE